MLKQEEIDSFNQTLLMKYGRKWDRPLYRLVHNNAILEKRYVEGTEFFGPYKLRDVKGIVEVQKYPRKDDKDKYILEILVEIPASLKEELHGEDGNVTYEPLFTFKKSVQGLMLHVDPTWPMINILAFFSYAMMKSGKGEDISPEYEMAKLDKKDYDEAMDILNEEFPDMSSALRKGSATFWDSSKQAYLIN